ncbi:MAG: ABC transporter ATP-binding protein, partial [Acholeplasmataceae bacterium]
KGEIMEAMIVKGICKNYETFKLNNVSFTLPQGFIMGFIGENGAGKTTTIKSILNIVNKDGGEVIVFGKNMDEEEINIKKNIGYISGESFYPKKRIKDITAVFKTFFDTWDEPVYQAYLKQFNLDENKRVYELSKGMKMKYELSLALSHHAHLLILDEPTSGLDPVVRDELLEIFQAIVEDGSTSVLFSTHITSDLDKCADFITFIQSGHIIDSLTKDDFIDKYRIVHGETDQLNLIKDKLISYKKNAFGFNGLIETNKLKETDLVKYAQPTLDEIMIYFAEKEKQHA